MTDNLPVDKIFSLSTLRKVVKYFCMQRIGPTELKRLVDRRFVPHVLISKNERGDFLPPAYQMFDDV